MQEGELSLKIYSNDSVSKFPLKPACFILFCFRIQRTEAFIIRSHNDFDVHSIEY